VKHSYIRIVVILLLSLTLISWLDVFPKEIDELTGLASGAVTMCINTRPEINQSCDTTINASKTFNCLSINGSAKNLDQNVSFSDNTSLFNIQTFPSLTTNTTGNISFLATEDNVGLHDIKLTVTENGSCSNGVSSLAFTLEVISTCTNAVPELNVSCNTSISVGNYFQCYVSGSAKDDNQNVTISDNTSIFNVTTLPTFESNTSGNISFTPTENDLGLHQINLSILDNSSCRDLQLSTFVLYNLSVVRICGDNQCQANESQTSCPEDCGTPPVAEEEEEEDKDDEGRRRSRAPSKPSPDGKLDTPTPTEDTDLIDTLIDDEDIEKEPSIEKAAKTFSKWLISKIRTNIAGLVGKGLNGIKRMGIKLKEDAVTRAILLTLITIGALSYFHYARKKRKRGRKILGKNKKRKEKTIQK
jgi:hypothetical protein